MARAHLQQEEACTDDTPSANDADRDRRHPRSAQGKGWWPRE
jgi:hypothetical protein